MGVMDEFIRLRILVESREAKEARRNLDDLDAAARRSSRGGFRDLSDSADPRRGNSSGMALLLLSQAVEDMQYGFSSIVNNIPGIVMAFGGSAGLAGAASIAAVAFNQLYKNVGSLEELLRGSALEAFTKPSNIERWTFNWSAGFYGMLSQIHGMGGMFQQPTLEDEDRRRKDAAEREQIKERPKRVVEGVDKSRSNPVGQAVRSAVEKAGGGKKLIDDLIASSEYGEERFGEPAERRDSRNKLRQRLMATIARALEGNGQQARWLADNLRSTDFGRTLMTGLRPAVEEMQTDRNKDAFANLMHRFDRMQARANPSAPRSSARSEAAAGGQMQGYLESLGIGADTQRAIGSALLGDGDKAGPPDLRRTEQNFADIPTIFGMLQEAGATEREMYEALPLILARRKKGQNVFSATQAVINQMTRNGMRRDLRGMRQGDRRQRAMTGAQMLGIDPGFGEDQTSRVGDQFLWNPAAIDRTGGVAFDAGGAAVDLRAFQMRQTATLEDNTKSIDGLSSLLRQMLDRGVQTMMPPRRR